MSNVTTNDWRKESGKIYHKIDRIAQYLLKTAKLTINEHEEVTQILEDIHRIFDWICMSNRTHIEVVKGVHMMRDLRTPLLKYEASCRVSQK